MEGGVFVFWLILVNGVLCTESVIHLFRHCEKEITIGNNVKQSLEISGMEWPPKLYACPLTFKSTGKFDLVYYEFERFDVNNDDIEISLQASNEEQEGFKNQGVFGALTSPPLSTVRTASRYFRLMVTRGLLSSYDFSVSLKLHAETGAHGTSLRSGQIVGIVIGSLVFIVALITLIVCCAIGAKYPDRRGSIYTVARRLSIFAVPTNQPSGDDPEDVAEEEIKSSKKKEDVGQVIEGYKVD
ncbi:uncharacterized protein LOC135471193 [Liolophura sinensis]|uniref:uncharacterized protein LOC135471193 n=1 Tax=Liolophura sinensis TaxID=3198878 RepID=UPI0031592CDF